MTPYEKAMKLIESEHEIVKTVFRYIDRLNDPVDDADYNNTVNELVTALNFVCQLHLNAIWSK